MTNLDIIKYLAHNNPDRLAEFLDDIYCIGWNCGAYEQRHIDDNDTSAVDIDFVESKWLDQKAGEDFFLDDELKEWSKFTDWISVNDRLPEEDVRVLVWLNTNRSYTKIDTDRRFEGKWVRWASDVTHWMPLPTPPTEKEN